MQFLGVAVNSSCPADTPMQQRSLSLPDCMQLVLQNHPCRAFLGISDLSFQRFISTGFCLMCLLRPQMILFIVTAKNVWVLYFRKQYLVFRPCPSCFHSSTNTSSLLSLLPCKTEWFCSVFSGTITLLSNILLTQFIKQYCQSTLLPLQLKYVLVVLKGLKIWFECLPVFCITVYFSDVSLKKICVGLL